MTPTLVREFNIGDSVAVYNAMNRYAKMEMARWGIHSPMELGYHILAAEFAFIGFHKNKLIAVAGAWPSSLVSQQAELWMIITDEAHAHPFTFIRRCQIEFAKLKPRYRMFRCWVGTHVVGHEKWMRLMGFKSKGVSTIEGLDYIDYRMETN